MARDEVEDASGGPMNESDPLDEALDRKNNSIMSPEGRELGQYVRNLYASGAKLWTVEALRHVEEELTKDPRPESVMIRSMNGSLKNERIPTRWYSYSPGENERTWTQPHFELYQSLVQRAEQDLCPQGVPRTVDDELRTDAACGLTIRMSSQTSPVAEPTYTELRAEWDAAWQEWTASATCAELTATLRGAKRMPRRVRNVVCFGLGGLAPDRGVMQERGGDGDGDGESHGHGHGHDRAARRCMAQHAAAITIAEVLRERLGLCERPAILAQEPAYYDADIQLLGELGIKVVTGAGGLGFTHVDNESVVMSCHPNIPVKQVVADIARPALMVWNKVQPVEEETDQWRRGDGQSMIAPWTTDEDSPRTRKLIEGYDKYPFPEDNDWFGNLLIYVRIDD